MILLIIVTQVKANSTSDNSRLMTSQLMSTNESWDDLYKIAVINMKLRALMGTSSDILNFCF